MNLHRIAMPWNESAANEQPATLSPGQVRTQALARLFAASTLGLFIAYAVAHLMHVPLERLIMGALMTWGVVAGAASAWALRSADPGRYAPLDDQEKGA